MGKNYYEANSQNKHFFEEANDLLGFDIANIMFNGTDADLKQTNVTQPAIFLHSMIAYNNIENPAPAMVAGHSLGEFSALVANGVLVCNDALLLVSKRAIAMQKACEIQPSTMAAILALNDNTVEEICNDIMHTHNEVVVPANYNSPGQLVISGSIKGIEIACEKMKQAGAKRALVLPVGGAFHSPLMLPAKQELQAAIEATIFNTPTCPIYQNVQAQATTDAALIKQNLIAQLTASVKWTQTIQQMNSDGATHFVEVGPGKVLQGLVQKICKEVTVAGIN
jgi:[acyl-carrier-protein] S-malonyltransferase